MRYPTELLRKGRFMLPTGQQVLDLVPPWNEAPHRSVAFHHEAIHWSYGFWGDRPGHNSSAVLVRQGDHDCWEVFAAGSPEPALEWLAWRSQGRLMSIMAPPTWEDAIQGRAARLDRATVRTWIRPVPGSPKPDRVPVRRLEPGDERAFRALAPDWSLRSWVHFESMIDQGVAFGISHGEGLAAVAWTYESSHEADKMGVVTAERFQRLGLGLAVASKLVNHILLDREKEPVWTTHDANPASMALARSLGFSAQVAETLFHWTPIVPKYRKT